MVWWACKQPYASNLEAIIFFRLLVRVYSSMIDDVVIEQTMWGDATSSYACAPTVIPTALVHGEG